MAVQTSTATVRGEPADAPERHEAVVIGAGPAGLAAAAMLQAADIETLVLERGPDVAASWRHHYDRLHLHTIRWLSALPGLPIPRSEGPWVSRDGVIRYLEGYRRHHRIRVRCNTEVTGIERADHGWSVDTNGGAILAGAVVVATGFNRDPFLPPWPGRESFEGELIHSSSYRNAEPCRGKDVLVVGTGNSGAEIAVDLVEGGARTVRIAVRTPPNIMRRDVAGFPSQALGLATRRLPPAVIDRMSLVMQRLTVGDLTRHGLPPPPRGVHTRAAEGVIPILDVGLIGMLKDGRVQVVAAVDRFEARDVVLADGSRLQPDAVIAATGFRRGLEPLVGRFGILKPNGQPVVHGGRTDPRAPDLYFIGYTNPLSGNLREVGIDGRRIARAVAGRRRRRP